MPALIITIGFGDWNGGKCPRLEFLLSLLERLKAIGWTIGVDLKGGDIRWAKPLADIINAAGGVMVWHPSLFPTLGWGSTEFELNDTVKGWAEQAREAKEKFGLRVLNIHLGALQYAKPAPSGPDRFNCHLTALEVLAAIETHIPLIKDLNELSGGILTIENVHQYLFNEEAYSRYYLYNAMQIGSWMDLPWLAQQTGVSTCVDAEHFLGSFKFLCRRPGFKSLAKGRIRGKTSFDNMLSTVAGYQVRNGFAPLATQSIGLYGYLQKCQPKLIHLGTTDQGVTHGKCADHREFDLGNTVEEQRLRVQLEYAEQHEVIGCVIESCGQEEGNLYWTRQGRSPDPDQAKFNAFLSALQVLEEMHGIKN